MPAARTQPASRLYATDGVATACVAGESGMMNQATRYARAPRTMQPGIIVNIAQITRTRVASTLKYSARPPHTPAIFRSVVDRVKRRVSAPALAGLLVLLALTALQAKALPG